MIQNVYPKNKQNSAMILYTYNCVVLWAFIFTRNNNDICKKLPTGHLENV